jgi:hypothetical protein
MRHILPHVRLRAAVRRPPLQHPHKDGASLGGQAGNSAVSPQVVQYAAENDTNAQYVVSGARYEYPPLVS